MASSDVVVRPDFRGDFRRPLLMARIGVRVKKVDDKRFAPRLLQLGHSRAEFGFVERRVDRAARQDAFSHFQSEIARDDRHEDPVIP